MKRLPTILVIAAAFVSSRTSFAQPTEDPDPVPRAAFTLGAERVDPFVGSFSTDIPIEVP